MKIFEEMWSGVSDKVTDLIFRMEQFDPEFLHYLGSRWQLDRARTIHEAPTDGEPAAVAGSNIRAQQEAAIAASKGPSDRKLEPVRNASRKVGRNDPCPCGSGKKFKACCMRKEGNADGFLKRSGGENGDFPPDPMRFHRRPPRPVPGGSSHSPNLTPLSATT